MPAVGKGYWAGTCSQKKQISQHCTGWGAGFQEELKGGEKKSNLIVREGALSFGRALHDAATCSSPGPGSGAQAMPPALHNRRSPQLWHKPRVSHCSASASAIPPAGVSWEGRGGGYRPVLKTQLSVSSASRNKRSINEVPAISIT